VLLLASCGSTNVSAKKPVIVSPQKPVEQVAKQETLQVEPVVDDDAVFQMRQMHLLEWIEKARRDCERTRSTDAYLPEREGFLPEEITLVKTRCAEGAEVGMRGDAWVNAMATCAHWFARANGKGKHECRLFLKDVPDLPPELFDLHKAACTESCARAGAEEIDMQKERDQPVTCCDGTLSTSCTNRMSLQGCCAQHRGVCLE
jgi:hypothetical protein